MSKEILEKAIQKAIDGGWKPECMNDLTNFKVFICLGSGFVCWFSDDGMEVIENVERVIFNHGFTKALWGYGKGIKQYDVVPDIDAWQYHLQQMVTAEDPIAYLGANL